MINNITEFIFVDLLLIHFLSLSFHDYINIYPFNDVESLRRFIPPAKRFWVTLIKSLPALIIFVLALLYFGEWKPLIIRMIFFGYFIFWLIIIYFIWYLPYFFGAAAETKLKFQNHFGRTNQILPAIKDNPRPNTLHFLLHILFVLNFINMMFSGYNPITPF